jgi:hypothetical protein
MTPRTPIELIDHLADRHATALEAECPHDWCYALLFLTVGPGGYITCTANLPNDELAKALREYAASLEAHLR